MGKLAISIEKMKPSRCSVVGCTSQHRSVHNVPASEETRVKWIEFIFNGNVPERIGKSLLVCASHFELDCFTNLGQYNSGLATRLTLQARSVPSICRSTDEGIVSIFKNNYFDRLVWAVSDVTNVGEGLGGCYVIP